MEVIQMSLADKLRKFRQQCERSAGTPASDIEVPLSHVLDDVSRAFNLSTKSRRKIVGRKSYVRFENLRGSRVELIERGGGSD
jgi:hypothetical protein